MALWGLLSPQHIQSRLQQHEQVENQHEHSLSLQLVSFVQDTLVLLEAVSKDKYLLALMCRSVVIMILQPPANPTH